MKRRVLHFLPALVAFALLATSGVVIDFPYYGLLIGLAFVLFSFIALVQVTYAISKRISSKFWKALFLLSWLPIFLGASSIIAAFAMGTFDGRRLAGPEDVPISGGRIYDSSGFSETFSVYVERPLFGPVYYRKVLCSSPTEYLRNDFKVIDEKTLKCNEAYLQY